MKTLFFDCRSGVCSDMILSGLLDMGLDLDCPAKTELRELVTAELNADAIARMEGHHHHDHEEGHHHTSYKQILAIIDKAPLTEGAKAMAGNIYRVIAQGEAKVHGTDLDHVHFHEVGRIDAIMNILLIAAGIDTIGADDIVCSDIHDGCGTIMCSHGEIPVPVPAVMAIRESEEAKKLHYSFVEDKIEDEMVTPSGLGILVGIGARFGYFPEDDAVLARGMGRGAKDLGLPGMEITLLEDGEFE